MTKRLPHKQKTRPRSEVVFSDVQSAPPVHQQPAPPPQVVYVEREAPPVYQQVPQQQPVQIESLPGEATSKRWKAYLGAGLLSMLVGAGMMLIGFVFLGASNHSGIPIGGCGAMGVMFGFVMYVVGRVGAWWCHG